MAASSTTPNIARVRRMAGEERAKGRLPDFIIAGATRSGTTALARYLGAHPELWMTPTKEVRFFNKRYDLGLDWYREHFVDAPADNLVGEATPAYFAIPVALERMAQTVPRAKLILSMRNPVDRLWSQYWMRHSNGLESEGFAEIIRREIDLYRDFGPESAEVLHLRGSLYGHNLGSVLEFFPREQVHVQIFERMLADPGGEFANTCSFLGVDSEYRPDNLGVVINAHTQFRSVRVRNIVKNVGGRNVKRLVGRLNAKTNATYPEMDPVMRQTLEEFFAEDVRVFERTLATRVDEWRAT